MAATAAGLSGEQQQRVAIAPALGATPGQVTAGLARIGASRAVADVLRSD